MFIKQNDPPKETHKLRGNFLSLSRYQGRCQGPNAAWIFDLSGFGETILDVPLEVRIEGY